MRNIRVRLLGLNEANSEMLKVVDWARSQQLAEISLDFSDDAESILKKRDLNFDVCRLHGDYQTLFYQNFKGLPAEIVSLGRFDTLINQAEVLWPKNFLKKSFHEIVLSRCSKLDNSSESIVLGVDYCAKIAIKVLTELGFSKISIVDEDNNKVDEFVKSLQKIYLGITFNALNLGELVLQAGANSICVNTLEFQESSTQLADILYFNYLKPGGFVANFARGPFDKDGNDLLLAEASSVKSPVASAWDLNLGLELLWLDSLLNAKGRVYLKGLLDIKN